MHSGQLHSSILMRARRTHVLLSYNPSFHRRVLPFSFHPVSTILLARRRCSRITKLSSLHPFDRFNSIPVCTSIHAKRRLQRAVPCYFIRGGCPKIPHLRLRAIIPRMSFRIGKLYIAPIRIVRTGLPVLNCHVRGVTCVASVGSVTSGRVRFLRNLSLLVIGKLHRGPRLSRRAVRRTYSFTLHLKIPQAFLVRVKRDVGSRAVRRRYLPRNVRLTCSNLRIALWDFDSHQISTNQWASFRPEKGYQNYPIKES